MAVFPQVLAGANNDIDTVNTGLNSHLNIVHVTPDVGQNLGLEAELADGFAVLARLLTCARAGELDAVNTELIERLGDLDLSLSVEVCVGELLALTECRLDDLEARDVRQVVTDGLVWVRALVGLRGSRLDLGEAVVS